MTEIPPIVKGKIDPMMLPRDHHDHPVWKMLQALSEIRQRYWQKGDPRVGLCDAIAKDVIRLYE